MNFNVFLDSANERIKNYVNITIEKMNAHQWEFQLIDKQSTVDNKNICECIKNSLNSSNEISFVKAKNALEQLNIFDKYIIVTDKPFDDNWFSHHAADYWFISVSDWDELYAPPHMDKYIQYEIIQCFAKCAANLSDSQFEQVYDNHYVTTGDCLFDFCMRKEDIKISMRTGRLCPACERKLIEFGVKNEQFQAINILIRLMTGKSTFEKVFIVHGHGEYKETVARYVEKMGIIPIILSEQANRGRTIIEKFENESSKADFAIILYTPDDIGGVAGSSYDSLRPRARQNVVFEHGFFTSKLGRENVVVLLKNDTEKTKLETAGDNDGIVYITFDEHGGWKEQIKQALILSGYCINPRIQ
jgi:predicted nucleotide-binding protein